MSTSPQIVVPTESLNPKTQHIDQVDTSTMLRLINAEDALVAQAVESCIPQLVPLVDAAVKTIRNGGSLFYLGAGTSGRLAVLDAAECPPTYNVPASLVQAFIAGGSPALQYAAEGAEDDAEAGSACIWNAVQLLTVKPVVIGLSASGGAAYVLGGINAAKAAGCVTGGITCHCGSLLAKAVDYAVTASVGPEVIAGSTRMKAGTAQKLILNMISTSVMVQLGKTYQNWMVDVRPTNQKLRQRAIRIVSALGQVSDEQAELFLHSASMAVKPAVVMARLDCSLAEAEQLLTQAHGKLRDVLFPAG